MGLSATARAEARREVPHHSGPTAGQRLHSLAPFNSAEPGSKDVWPCGLCEIRQIQHVAWLLAVAPFSAVATVPVLYHTGRHLHAYACPARHEQRSHTSTVFFIGHHLR